MRWLSDHVVDRLREEADLPDLGNTKYVVIHKLGSGGMGTVYLAQDADLGRKVAVKVMNVVDSTGALSARMMREARIVALLEHPSIVPIHDVGTLDDGRVFYAMKLVQGRRLDQTVSETAPLSDLLRMFQKVCEAVAFAHSRGVIHRDLKPENIMVGTFGEVLVMDWGIAKVLHSGGEEHVISQTSRDSFESVEDADMVTTLPLADGSPSHTSGGTVIGTPAYMAPEQALGQTELLDERSDLYALGAILFFLLTGRPPREPGDPEAREVPRNLVRPRQLNASIPKAIEAVCVTAMSEKPEDRYKSAEALSADVVNFLDGNPVSAYRENILEKFWRWMGKNRFIVLLIIAYLIMRLIVLFFAGR